MNSIEKQNKNNTELGKCRRFVTKPLQRLFVIKPLLECHHRKKNVDTLRRGVSSYSRSPFGDQRKIRRLSDSLLRGNLQINTEDFTFTTTSFDCCSANKSFTRRTHKYEKAHWRRSDDNNESCSFFDCCL